MMGGDFQKPLQLLAAYGYYAFEDDLCVNPSNSPYGRPTYANISFSEIFAGPFVDQPEVVDEGLDYPAAPIFGVLCWGYVSPLWWRPRRSRYEVQRRGNFKWVNADSFSSFDFPLFLFVFLLVFLFALFHLSLF